MPAACERSSIHFGPIDLTMSRVADNDRMSTKQQFRLRLNKAIGDLVRDLLRMLIIQAILEASISYKAVVFQIEPIERQCENKLRQFYAFQPALFGRGNDGRDSHGRPAN